MTAAHASAETQMRDGDIFRWHYRGPGNDGEFGRYHCCSHIAIFQNGRLHDTYWMHGTEPPSEGRKFGPNDMGKITLTYLGNFSDFYKSDEYEVDYYDDNDILNLNHANSTRGNFYLRKGAKRSAEKMLSAAKRNLIAAQDEQRSAAYREERARVAIDRIEAGDLTGFVS